MLQLSGSMRQITNINTQTPNKSANQDWPIYLAFGI
jgi:hypothetical protein